MGAGREGSPCRGVYFCTQAPATEIGTRHRRIKTSAGTARLRRFLAARSEFARTTRLADVGKCGSSERRNPIDAESGCFIGAASSFGERFNLEGDESLDDFTGAWSANRLLRQHLP